MTKPAFWLLCLLQLLLLPAGGLAAPTTAETTTARPERSVDVYFFWSATCPHCLEARPEIQAMAADRPWIRLHDLELSRHPENAERYRAMARQLGEEAMYVPALFYCGQLATGWNGGAALLAALEACRTADLAAPPPAAATLQLPLLGTISGEQFSLPLLTLVIAGLDAFNPCAFFVLLFLLSLLVHQQSRRRMLIIGGVFVLCAGLMYFAFMAAWLNLFLVLGNLPWITAAAGLLALAIGIINIKDFIAFNQGISLSLPASRKARIFERGRRILKAASLPAMLGATVLLAIAANFYELLCTAGFPMVFTRLLTLQVGSATGRYLYLALYNLIYVLPLLLIVLAFVYKMGSRKLSEREGRLLKLLSGLMMFGLGALLLAAPQYLGHPGPAFGLLLAAGGLTWLAARRWRR